MIELWIHLLLIQIVARNPTKHGSKVVHGSKTKRGGIPIDRDIVIGGMTGRIGT